MTIRNTTLQQNSTVVHAYSNALDNQRGKENGITNLTLLDEGMWNDIPRHEKRAIDWVRKRTPMEAAWRRAVQQLNTLAKIEGVTPEEIKMIKDNPPEPLELNWDAEPIINLLNPEQFHEHYQELAPTREEGEQQLEQLNA
ncbi:hypothetical protein G9A89_008827 [Geosiphon pyriformis]|nr:hypothetical protein G9A89_008827 [Geosiphon pyriformis]